MQTQGALLHRSVSEVVHEKECSFSCMQSSNCSQLEPCHMAMLWTGDRARVNVMQWVDASPKDRGTLRKGISVLQSNCLANDQDLRSPQ